MHLTGSFWMYRQEKTDALQKNHMPYGNLTKFAGWNCYNKENHA